MNATGNDDGSNALIPNRASGYVPVGMQDVENTPFLNWSIKTGNGSLYSTVEDLGVVTFMKGAHGEVTGLTWNFGNDFKTARLP